MKKTISILFFILFIISCASKPQAVVKPEDKNLKFVGNNQIISIFPTYRYVGEQDFSDENVLRVYHIWYNDFDGKIIMIYHLKMKKGMFPNNVQWLDKNSALFVEGMRAAYTNVIGRALIALNNSNIKLPDCYILGQEVHINKNNKEAVLRMLITPDKMCSEEYMKTMNELDRVAIIKSSGD